MMTDIMQLKKQNSGKSGLCVFCLASYLVEGLSGGEGRRGREIKRDDRARMSEALYRLVHCFLMAIL